MDIHHVGYLVKDIEKASVSFMNLSYELEGEVVYDPLRDVDILFMVNGQYRIELVSPRSKESVVAETLKKLGNAPYHICYYCDDMMLGSKDPQLFLENLIFYNIYKLFGLP